MAGKGGVLKDPEIPSQILDRKYIYYPPKEQPEEECSTFADANNFLSQKNKYCKNKKHMGQFYGKWMLHFNIKDICLTTEMTEHDSNWKIVKSLVDDAEATSVRSAICSTGYTGKYGGVDPSRPIGGVICCYTKDYRDKRDVKKAADSIRGALDFQQDMYYKTDEATVMGRNTFYGQKHISIYKHTVFGEFLERDGSSKNWNLVYLE